MDCAERKDDFQTRTNLFRLSSVINFNASGSLSLEGHPSDKWVTEDGQVGPIHVGKDVRPEHRLSFAISDSNVLKGSAAIGFHHAAIWILKRWNSNEEFFAAVRRALKLAVHDVGIHVPMNRVQESVWNPPNNIEVETLPKAHGPVIGAHDEIELHCPESAVSSMVKRMRTHRSSETFARGVGCGYVSAV
jgi:hypothetical protein